jgi:hypothetical protein
MAGEDKCPAFLFRLCMRPRHALEFGIPTRVSRRPPTRLWLSNSHRRRKAEVHAAGIPLDRSVKEALHTGKSTIWLNRRMSGAAFPGWHLEMMFSPSRQLRVKPVPSAIQPLDRAFSRLQTGVVMPASIFKTVLLPAPFRPTMPRAALPVNWPEGQMSGPGLRPGHQAPGSSMDSFSCIEP